MIFAFAFPQGMPTIDDVIRVLAIVGGFALGGFGTGFLTQMVVKGYTGQQVPRWVLMVLRLLGGTALACLVYSLVYSQAGNDVLGHLFGGAGNNNKPGNSAPQATTPGTTPTDKTPPEKDKSSSAPVDKGSVLRIEVLGNEPLQEIAKRNGQTFDPDHCYRIEEAEPMMLLTLKEARDYIRQRSDREPPLRRIELVLYRDSPQKKVARVSDLKQWADDLTSKGEKVLVDYKEAGEDAPIR
jgi:hypothetical protein